MLKTLTSLAIGPLALITEFAAEQDWIGDVSDPTDEILVQLLPRLIAWVYCSLCR